MLLLLFVFGLVVIVSTLLGGDIAKDRLSSGTAVGSMRDGAYDFIEKPFASDRLAEVVGRALEKRRLTLENRALKRELKAQDTLGPRLIDRTEAMRRVQERLLTIAETDVDILISGETGAGKEVAARFVHQHSPRRDGPFVAVNAGTTSLSCCSIFSSPPQHASSGSRPWSA